MEYSKYLNYFDWIALIGFGNNNNFTWKYDSSRTVADDRRCTLPNQKWNFARAWRQLHKFENCLFCFFCRSSTARLSPVAVMMVRPPSCSPHKTKYKFKFKFAFNGHRKYVRNYLAAHVSRYCVLRRFIFNSKHIKLKQFNLACKRNHILFYVDARSFVRWLGRSHAIRWSNNNRIKIIFIRISLHFGLIPYKINYENKWCGEHNGKRQSKTKTTANGVRSELFEMYCADVELVIGHLMWRRKTIIIKMKWDMPVLSIVVQ